MNRSEKSLRSGTVKISSNGRVLGTGFLVSRDGIILTCTHVVGFSDSKQPKIFEVAFLNTPGRYKARLLECKPTDKEDVAILKLLDALPKSARPLLFGSSRNAQGHNFSTIGFPTSLNEIRAEGQIQGVSKPKDIFMLQLRSPELTQGFSGAPIFDTNTGRVVGMVSAIAQKDENSRLGITAFGISSESIQQIWPGIKIVPSLTYQQAGFFVGAITFLLLLSILGYWFLRPQRMGGVYNVAVVRFTIVGADGNSNAGDELANGIYETLRQNIQELQLDFPVTIWGPDKTGRALNVESNFQSQAVQELADKIGADLIIYGSVDATQPVWRVTPRFYVSSTNFYDAQEIMGSYALGGEIELRGQDQLSGRIVLVDEIRPRIQALSQITVGLAYFAIQDYPKALAALNVADQIPEWKASQGKEVLYLLMGNTYGKLGQYADAQAFYERSLALDPEYGRAIVGLGSVYYDWALAPFGNSKNPETIDQNLLVKSIVTYQQALNARNQPELSDIQTKVDMGLGQCYMMQVYGGQGSSFAPAIEKFNAVIAEYGNGSNPRVQELAAEAHARLGLVYKLTGNYRQAAAEYEDAAKLLPTNPQRQSQYTERARESREQVTQP